MLEKIKDFFANIKYYCLYKPKSKYYYFKIWWRDCMSNPYYRKQLKRYFGYYRPWDHSYFIQMQYDWLNWSIYYYENRSKHIPEETKKFILKKMKMAKLMLDIYMENIDLSEFEFIENPDAGPDVPCIKELKHTCIPKVNLRNQNRFKYLITRQLNSEYNWSTHMYSSFPEELYRAKALNIYLKIVQDYHMTWWD
jgi:hypothetical protein